MAKRVHITWTEWDIAPPYQHQREAWLTPQQLDRYWELQRRDSLTAARDYALSVSRRPD